MVNNDVQNFFDDLWAIQGHNGVWLSSDILFLVHHHLDSSLDIELIQYEMHVCNTDEMLVDFLEEEHLINRHDATNRLMALRQRPKPIPNDPKFRAVYQLIKDAGNLVH